MELRRTHMSLLVGLGAVLLAIPALGAKPAVTGLCVLSGDVQSLDAGELVPVEIGVSTTAWELLDPDTGFKTTLRLQGTVLHATGLPAGPYFGQARILKNNGQEGGRFDFDFDTAECVSPVWGDTPPFGYPDNNLCRYHLTIRDGVYYRGADEVSWDGTARVDLLDYGLGVPCAVDPDASEGCVPPGGYLVGSGPLGSLTAQFGTGGEEEPPSEPEPEKSKKACRDGADNDGDGLIDEADSDCAKWY